MPAPKKRRPRVQRARGTALAGRKLRERLTPGSAARYAGQRWTVESITRKRVFIRNHKSRLGLYLSSTEGAAQADGGLVLS